jgi:hypothetical protein
MSNQDEQRAGVEHATLSARNTPRHWGLPKGDRDSDERRDWVAANVNADIEVRAKGVDPANGKPLPLNSPAVLRAQIARLKRTPQT